VVALCGVCADWNFTNKTVAWPLPPRRFWAAWVLGVVVGPNTLDGELTEVTMW